MPLENSDSNNKDKLFDQYWNEEDKNYPDKPDSKVIYKKLQQGLFKQPAADRSLIRPLRKWIVYPAASILLFLGCFYFYKFNSNKQISNNGGYTKVSTIGERKILTLPDSSKVELFEHSTIEYQGLSDISSKRYVKLNGKATFSVVHNAIHPFKVFTNDLTVEDIGTIFTIATDPSAISHHTSIKVEEGSVHVSYKKEKNRETVLVKGDLLNYENTGRITVSNPLILRNKTITFNNASFAEVLTQLNQVYGINIKCTTSTAANKTYSGTFKGEKIDKILDMIGFTLGFKYYSKKDEIIVYFDEN